MTRTTMPNRSSFTPMSTGLLQRKCACGTKSPGGSCSKCDDDKRGTLQRRATSDRDVGEVPPIVYDVLREPGVPLDRATRDFFEPRFGADFGDVRVHTGERATRSALAVDAQAYTIGNHVAFDNKEFSPRSPDGLKLIAHELWHVRQNQGAASGDLNPSRVESVESPAEKEAESGSAQIMASEYQATEPSPHARGSLRRQQKPSTPGGVAKVKADDWLKTDAGIKIHVDVIKAALREVKAKKNVSFNKTAAKSHIDDIGALLQLKPSEIAALQTKWTWLVDNVSKKFDKAYQSGEQAFFQSLRSPLTKVSDQHPKSQSKYWLKNTPTKVLDLMYDVADTDLPADQLYAYASKEGLVDYIRDQIGVTSGQEASDSQLAGFDTTKSVDGFVNLGLDDYGTELNAPRQPLSGFLPTGFDQTKVTITDHVNEKGRTVKSATTPNLKMGLQALAAMLKRRRKLFLEDAKTSGYATPTTNELVYWTYVYFNTGEFGGKKQLEKYKGKRKLDDWIKSNEYDNSLKLLDSWKMITDLKIF